MTKSLTTGGYGTDFPSVFRDVPFLNAMDAERPIIDINQPPSTQISGIELGLFGTDVPAFPSQYHSRVQAGEAQVPAVVEQSFWHDLPVDLLFINDIEDYKDALVDAFRRRGINIVNVCTVGADLYPAGDFKDGKREDLGTDTYMVGYPLEPGKYTFHGELDPKNILIISESRHRYGRMFSQVCEVLGEYKGRKIGLDVIPPTYVFFKEMFKEDGGDTMATNMLMRLI